MREQFITESGGEEAFDERNCTLIRLAIDTGAKECG